LLWQLKVINKEEMYYKKTKIKKAKQ